MRTRSQRIAAFLTAAVILCMLLAGCGAETGKAQNDDAGDFTGKKIGVPAGSAYDITLLKYIPDAQIEYLNSNADLSVALAAGKIDAYVTDQPVARLMGKEYPQQVIAVQFEDADYGFMFPKDEAHQMLCNQFNEFVAESWENGTIAEIDSIWFGEDDKLKNLDISDLTAENGVLEMAVTSDVGAPFTYYFTDKLVGYEIDLAARFCREYGYGLHISDYNIAGVLAATSTGKADMAASTICITPERQETSLMSDREYIGGIVLVTKQEQAEAEKVSFVESLKDSFERTFVRENRWKMFLSGLGITFSITVVSVMLGSLTGFGAYLLNRKKWKLFDFCWHLLSSFMGKTPVVVILMILYYIVFGRSNLNSVWVSIIGFTVLFACTVAELLKMGAEAVDGGQTEAALALGYSEQQTYLRIIFPQSISHFLPAYKNEVVSLVKATAVVGYIAVQDLTKVSDLIRARTYEAFFPLIATAIIYFMLASALTRIIRRVNMISDPHRRSKEKILRGVNAE